MTTDPLKKESTNSLGSIGEKLAREHLEAEGYAIIDTNWRLGRHEADIIAYYEGTLVFVEVKTRQDDNLGQPEEAVTLSKQRGYIKLANAYMLSRRREEEVRFDIISIIIRPTNFQLKHIVNAFSAVGLYL